MASDRSKWHARCGEELVIATLMDLSSPPPSAWANPLSSLLYPSVPRHSPAPEERFRDRLHAAATRLSHDARSRSRGELEFDTELEDPWFRTADFLDEISEDLGDSQPIGDRAVEWATLLTMVADHLDLHLVDEAFHTLLFAFIETCLLVHLERERAREGRFTGGAEIPDRIRSRLDFVNEQLESRRPAYSSRPGAAA